MRILVTGAGGFIGSHLVEWLRARGHAVCAATHRADPQAGTDARAGSVTDQAFVRNAVDAVRPERVFHLAALSLPEQSWHEPFATFDINVLGTLNVLEAVREVVPAARVIVAGSSAEYAPDPQGRPLAEDAPLNPISLYGVTKLAQDRLAQLFAARYGLRVVRARPFFLIGPRKTGDVCSDVARRLVDIERGQRADLPVGDLEVVRDLLDIRDGISGLWTLAERGEPGQVYNVCSGRGVLIRDAVERMIRLAGLKVAPRQSPELLRPIDEKIKVGNPARLQALGWAAQYDLDTSLKDILAYWREQKGRETACKR